MALPAYACREDVQRALDVAETARTSAQVDRLLLAASRSVEALCHRRFYPERYTRLWGWPDSQQGRSWRLWLDAHELISVTSMSSGGRSIAATDYFLEPQRSGPPYTRVELDLGSPTHFGGGATPQRDITITGLFGYRDDERPAGSLAEALDASETAVDVTDSLAIGVGHLIRIDDERMVVTGKTSLSTGQTINGALTASKADVSVLADDGTLFTAGEIILIDAERMLIIDIAGNTLIVERAFGGSVLAAHSSAATVYVSRTLTVTRGALGTTAATHSTATAIVRHTPPSLVEQLTIAETVVALQREQSGYARTIGSGESVRSAGSGDLKDLREQCYTAHGRKVRTRVVA